jgi:hypothetical protein
MPCMVGDHGESGVTLGQKTAAVTASCQEKRRIY